MSENANIRKKYELREKAASKEERARVAQLAVEAGVFVNGRYSEQTLSCLNEPLEGLIYQRLWRYADSKLSDEELLRIAVKIGRNAVVDAIRHANRFERRLATESGSEQGESKDAGSYAVLIGRLSELIAGLDPASQEVISLRFVGGLTFREIAAQKREATMTVHRRFVHALERIAELLTIAAEHDSELADSLPALIELAKVNRARPRDRRKRA